MTALAAASLPAGTAGLAALVRGRQTWFLDLDGTLVDSTRCHDAAFRAALGEHRPDLLGSFDYARHAGSSTREVVTDLGVVDPGRVGRLVRSKQQAYRRLVGTGGVAVLPGAHDLLAALNRRRREVYLVTSGSRGSAELVLQACGLGGQLAGVLTAEDVTRNKPDPEIYLEACRRWAVVAADAVVVEDSRHGVAAAVAAGLSTVQVHACGSDDGADVTAPGVWGLPGLPDLVALLESATCP